MNTRTLFLALAFPSLLFAQQKTETVHALSKQAQKGYMYEASLNDKGNLEVVYNIKVGKDGLKHEVYEFDRSLKFIGSREAEAWKTRYAHRPEKKVKRVHATVGGGTSFTILSTKLALYTRTVQKTWDAEKQRYNTKNFKKEEFVPKNAENRAFYGNVAYPAANGDLYLMVSSSKTEKDERSKEYSLLHVTPKQELTEFPVKFDRPHVLTYSILVPNGKATADDGDDEEIINKHDMLFVFAPSEGNLSEYTFIQMTTEGKERHRFTFAAPRSVTAITAHSTKADGTVYFCALAVDSRHPFTNAIGEYAPIVNPSYLKYGTPNYRMESYERKLEKMQFSDFVTMKLKDGKLEWANATPIADFKSKLKTPPSQKGGYCYDGRRFVVSSFHTTPDEGFIIMGQLRVPVFKPEPLNYSYKDLVCLRIDSKGNVVSQFSYRPNLDSKSAIFAIPQEVIAGSDGQSLYWVNYEVKAVKGYSSFSNAYHGVATFYANYYPSVGRIDLKSNSISDFDVMGGRKFLLNRQNAFVDVPDERSRIFVGEDRKGKILLAKYVME